MKPIALALLCALLPATTLAREGGTDSGGGTILVHAGDFKSAELADAYFDFSTTHGTTRVGRPFYYSDLSAATRQTVSEYVEIGGQIGFNSMYTFYATQLAPIELTPHFFYVSPEEFLTLPCDHYLPTITVKADTHLQFGCTINRDTYLIEEIFNLLPPRLQAQAVLHERLWVLQRVEQSVIARVSSTLEFLRALKEKQARGDRTRLTPDQILRLNEVFDAGELLGLRTSMHVNSSFADGGGVIHGVPACAPLTAQDFLGVGTHVYGYGTMSPLIEEGPSCAE